MATCSAPACGNSYRKGYVLVRFPKDVQLRELWKQAVGREDWSPSHDNRLCEVSFFFLFFSKPVAECAYYSSLLGTHKIM